MEDPTPKVFVMKKEKTMEETFAWARVHALEKQVVALEKQVVTFEKQVADLRHRLLEVEEARDFAWARVHALELIRKE